MKKRNLSILLASVSLAVFLFFLVTVITDTYLYMDNLGVVIAENRNGFWVGFFKVFTHLGSVYFMAGVSVILLIFDKDKKLAISVAVCLAVVGLLNLFVKLAVARPRPDYALMQEVGKSFPSGHSMISVCFYGYIGYLMFNAKTIFKWFYAIVASVFVLLLGFSRVYLGVHYLSDVLAGFCLGVVVLVVFVAVYHNLRYKK